MWAIRVLAVLVISCAPPIDSPRERARGLDRADADRLAHTLGELPGAVGAEVALHRPVRDPFDGTIDPPSATVLVVIDDRADAAEITVAAKRLVHALAPEVAAPEVVVTIGAHRPELAVVGPFTVEAHSKSRLAGALIAGLAVVAALAGFIAWTARPRRA